ncbi:iron chelate uptake ABC transporter family permease subunit [Streptomyces sp. NPDC050095]|uniref:iron chelate uptake ABC transporter family permease subunit n=1 Tax=unclassified Streptomyces TaxID=2593676 RepID=UPI00341971F8
MSPEAVVIALLTAAAVAVSGVIGFVGLVVPHLLRMQAGPGHRFLVPGSALGGAVVLVAADLAARTVAAPAELPIGVLTALTGSPFFAETRALRLALGGREVLSGVDLAVRAGEVLALVGPNGAGKSTLLAALAADLAPASGELPIAGRPAVSWTAPELALRRGLLPQSAELSFPFTVAEVVRMGRAPWAGTPHEDADDEAIAAALRSTQTTSFAPRPFSALSGGERARVALARVLDLGLATAHADRTAALHAGRITADGPPAEVFDGALPSEVYQHPVEVLPHPSSGAPLVIPIRS